MKTILMTGATSGIGLEASVVLAQQGHRVVMVGRDEAKTRACVDDVKRRSGSATVDWLLADFLKLDSVRALAAAYRAKYDRLDVLVNNAGTVFEKRTVTADGFEATWQVNHLGGFLLTHLLQDLVVRSAPGRIVVVSSVGHYRGTMDLQDPGFANGGYSIMGAYGRSKLANVMMTRSLAKRLQGTGVMVNALHPGAVATNIWSNAPRWTQPILGVVKALFMISPQAGAETITFLATSPEVDGKTGLYFEKNAPRTPSALSRDDTLCEALWALSETQTATRGNS